MTNVNSNNLSGAALDWAVKYALVLNDVMGERPDRRPLRAEHAKAKSFMEEITVAPLDELAIYKLSTQHNYCTFEDGGKWFAVVEPCNWSRDQDGNTTQISVYEEDSVQGDNVLVAIQRCFVSHQLGYEVEVPDSLVNSG